MKKGENIFKVGDIVEITAEADATGMLEFKSGNGYVVQDFRTAKAGVCREQVYLCGEGNSSEGWYAASHFKLKEEAKIEKKECLFKEGQVVWDVVYGKGVVVEISEYSAYPVVAQFSDETMAYTVDGKTYETHGRTLFFSEPKIEAATEPVFEPTLEPGMVVVALDKETSRFYPMVVREETEEDIESVHSVVLRKTLYDFYRLGEKIEFN